MIKTCLRCKGVNTTSSDYCAHCSKKMVVFRMKSFLEERFSEGSSYDSRSPGVFVGRFNYPNLGVGILNPINAKEADVSDAPRFWSANEYPIDKIVDFRSSLINSRNIVPVKKMNRHVEKAQEVAMAEKPVDVEVDYRKKPQFKMMMSPFVAPMGAYGEVKRVDLTSNPKISTGVQKIFDDVDLKAQAGIMKLHDKDYDEHFITKMLSVGTLGVKTERKLVPTRWSITATDDMLSKRLVEDVKDFKESGVLAYFGGYLGNYYLVLHIPGVWSYELFEIYTGSGRSKELQYSTDYEPYSGRKVYAVNCVGGYYASRLAVVENMKKRRFKASVLCLRFITDEYYAPLGVWVVREATRKAMKSTPLEFGSQDLMLRYATIFVKKKFGINLDEIFRKSILLRERKTQKRLGDF